MNEVQNPRATSNAATANAPVAAPEPNRDLATALGAVTAGRLALTPGASRVSLAVDAAMTDLYRARFDGEPPRVSAENGVVTIRYPRHSLVDWVKEALSGEQAAATIILNGTIPWRIEVEGGASRLSAELAGLRLEALRVGGGASQVELTLPRPAGVVPVRIGGGASNLAIHRPLGGAVRLRVRGGATQVTVDEQSFGAVGGELRWQSPDFASATDRYEIETGGGASTLTIAGR